MPRYSERLTPPVVWWVLAALLALSIGGALGFYLGLLWGVALLVGSFGVAVAVLVSASVEVRVEADRLVVGRAVLEVDYLDGAEALTTEQTTHRAGPGADARAYLVLRPYVPTAVEVRLDDPADPVPYWLVASRRPQQLAAAVNSLRAGRRAAS